MSTNIDIRKAVRESGLYFWQVAQCIGIGETTFSRRLRKELSDEEKEQIYKVIKILTQKKED